jgi:hypothetical protein
MRNGSPKLEEIPDFLLEEWEKRQEKAEWYLEEKMIKLIRVRHLGRNVGASDHARAVVAAR